ncbi:MAG: outer membrane lipoprotein carrier protein LolA [Bacteroidales bacterium]|nr:outer membrane lipoprotein carrier protein LolA [Bacteroidales bacterium]
MKKILNVFILIALLSGTVSAQKSETEITGNQLDVLVKKISTTHQQLKTLSAEFVQEKASSLFTEKVVQKGKFYYQAPKQLRWEYSSPQKLCLLFNDKKVSIVTEKGVVNNPNPMLNELGATIIGTINGSNLCDQKNFKGSFYKNGKSNYTAVLIPTNKKMKGNYKKIHVLIDGKSYLAKQVTLYEQSGDITTISFSHVTSNATLPNNLFTK